MPKQVITITETNGYRAYGYSTVPASEEEHKENVKRVYNGVASIMKNRQKNENQQKKEQKE